MSSLNFSATASKDTSLSKSGTVGPSISWASSIGRLKIKVAVIQHTQLSDSDFSAFLCILRSNYSCIDLSKLHTRSTRIGPNNGLIASPAFVPKELQSSDSTKVSYLSTDRKFAGPFH